MTFRPYVLWFPYLQKWYPLKVSGRKRFILKWLDWKIPFLHELFLLIFSILDYILYMYITETWKSLKLVKLMKSLSEVNVFAVKTPKKLFLRHHFFCISVIIDFYSTREISIPNLNRLITSSNPCQKCSHLKTNKNNNIILKKDT